jgi:hypothetical protein
VIASRNIPVQWFLTLETRSPWTTYNNKQQQTLGLDEVSLLDTKATSAPPRPPPPPTHACQKCLKHLITIINEVRILQHRSANNNPKKTPTNWCMSREGVYKLITNFPFPNGLWVEKVFTS